MLGGLLAVAAPNAADRIPLPGESRPVTARLDEARQRLAEKKFAEAVALLSGVIESSPNDLADAGSGRAVSARRLAQTILASAEPAALALYRQRIAAQAQRWLDAEEYHRLVDEAFCTPQAAVALDRLGDLAFSRGRLDEAEQWWRLLAPPVRTELSYPDPTPATAARVRAKQLLVQLHRGDAYWPAALAAYRQSYPDAQGTLARKTGKYADILARRADELRGARPDAEDWPTFGGTDGRGARAPASTDLAAALARLCRGGPTWRFDLSHRRRAVGALPVLPDQTPLDAARRMAFHPILVGHLALVADGQHVTAYDLDSGLASDWFDAAGKVTGFRPRPTLPTAADLRHTLTVAEDGVFARLGAQTVRDVRPSGEDLPLNADRGESILVSLALKPGPGGERLRWLVRASDPVHKEYAVFEGAQAVVDGRVFVAATRFVGEKAVTAIHCYPAHPEEAVVPLLWKTDVCESSDLLPASAGESGRTRHHLLTVASSIVAYCSHSGAVVAVDARTGRRAWAVRYPRRDGPEPLDEPELRDLTPCLFAGRSALRCAQRLRPSLLPRSGHGCGCLAARRTRRPEPAWRRCGPAHLHNLEQTARGPFGRRRTTRR